MATELAFRFNERRATQACALLLERAGGRSNYTRILKLLYLADRRAMQTCASPMTGSSIVNMKNGPVLSEVYDCIKGSGQHCFWDAHIATDGFDIRLLNPAGDSHLCDFDVEVLSELAEQYADASFSTMIDVVHELPEWSDPAPAKVAPLHAADVLRVLGYDEEAIEAHAQTNEHIRFVDNLLGLS